MNNPINRVKCEKAVLFTDLVDSVKLYQKLGDSRALEIIERHFEFIKPVISKFEGYFVKTIGDAVMALFSDPNRSMAAAIEIQKEVQKYNNTQSDPSTTIHIRIGLDFGPCELLGDELNPRDAFGNTVNRAARVQAKAGGDEIFITDSLYDKLLKSNYPFYNYLGLQSLKGLPLPVGIYQVIWKIDELQKFLNPSFMKNEDLLSPKDFRAKLKMAIKPVLLFIGDRKSQVSRNLELKLQELEKAYRHMLDFLYANIAEHRLNEIFPELPISYVPVLVYIKYGRIIKWKDDFGYLSNLDLEARNMIYENFMIAEPFIRTVDRNNFESEVLSSNIPVMLFFWLNSDKRCWATLSDLTELANKYQGLVKIMLVNFEVEEEIVRKLHVQTAPFVAVMVKGELRKTEARFLLQKEIEEIIRKIL